MPALSEKRKDDVKVRARAAELRGSLLEVVTTLTDAPHLLQWDNVLKKFSTINLQLMSVREQLRAILRQVVVHPKMVTDPNLAQALPLQLASSELPEMQAADAKDLRM
ncbi:hypothetical protein DUNSADRAFT_6837 [Dunaliella salina]|uniref:Uncharacterized protein n=1 Tax=Dunaliella salina TaxID=3046 RepID=A0ABQ7FTQ3_DUNSA|nr:hypothetical protein DUNSADRAFT_6837 [Dunaliella salina]|eukprot:KAF5825808.1 hypothetical protein DUNSADRAFT_6837 [Dunaliella salina]